MAVYFIRAGEDGPVKIGTAGSPHDRLNAMQASSPVRLKLAGIMPGGHAEERALHRRFAHLRLHGEWFRWSDEIAAIAAMLMGPALGVELFAEAVWRAYDRAPNTLFCDGGSPVTCTVNVSAEVMAAAYAYSCLTIGGMRPDLAAGSKPGSARKGVHPL